MRYIVCICLFFIYIFPGWSSRTLWDESLNAAQVRKLRELQDNLLTCMNDDSRTNTLKSPAEQAMDEIPITNMPIIASEPVRITPQNPLADEIFTDTLDEEDAGIFTKDAPQYYQYESLSSEPEFPYVAHEFIDSSELYEELNTDNNVSSAEALELLMDYISDQPDDGDVIEDHFIPSSGDEDFDDLDLDSLSILDEDDEVIPPPFTEVKYHDYVRRGKYWYFLPMNYINDGFVNQYLDEYGLENIENPPVDHLSNYLNEFDNALLFLLPDMDKPNLKDTFYPLNLTSKKNNLPTVDPTCHMPPYYLTRVTCSFISVKIKGPIEFVTIYDLLIHFNQVCFL